MRKVQLGSKKVQNRKAIAMIELIFAIVIIGITLMSIPNLVSQASKSGYTTIMQESIAAGAANMSLILSREWDESGTDASIGSPILDTNSSSILDTRPRPGELSRSYATGIGGTPRSASLTFDDGDFDDIDDAHGKPARLTPMGAVEDLIDLNITIATTVTYIKDTPSAGDWDGTGTLTFNDPFNSTNEVSGATSNIKSISISLTSDTGDSGVEELKKTISLKAFSCNVGSYKLERMEF